MTDQRDTAGNGDRRGGKQGRMEGGDPGKRSSRPCRPARSCSHLLRARLKMVRFPSFCLGNHSYCIVQYQPTLLEVCHAVGSEPRLLAYLSIYLVCPVPSSDSLSPRVFSYRCLLPGIVVAIAELLGDEKENKRIIRRGFTGHWYACDVVCPSLLAHKSNTSGAQPALLEE